MLLKAKIPVDGDEHVKLLFSQSEEFAILLACPSHSRHCLHSMAWKFACEPAVNTFVKQDVHLSYRFRHSLACLFQEGLNLFS